MLQLYKMLIFFTIFETLFQNVTAILPITYQNKTKAPGENKICLVIYKKRQTISTIYKLSEYNFWWNCLEFIHKIDLSIQRSILNNVKHSQATRFLTFLTMLGLEAKATICSAIKENLILYCRHLYILLYFRHLSLLS